MIRLSVDYAELVRGLRMPLVPADLGAILLDAVAERYENHFPDCSLLQFMQSGATYLFDLASAVEADQEDRTVAAWTVTPATVAKRDVSYQRGFPLPPDPDGTLVDRGHLIPHLSGGEFGPNIFRQQRDLNRGWSNQGKLSLPPCGGHPTCQAVPGGGSPDGTATPAVLAGIQG
jgi:hypothetical protein